jgi:uncharacterized protein (TIGR00369 family)
MQRIQGETMITANPDYINELKNVLNTSPYPTHMSMQLAAIDFDRAVIEMILGKNHLQPFGIVHGGVLATLIDTATFWAAFLKIPEDAGLVNIDLKLNYLRPVQHGKLRAEGLCIKAGRSISYAEAKILNEKREMLAHGTSTLMILPGKGLEIKTKKFLET